MNLKTTKKRHSLLIIISLLFTHFLCNAAPTPSIKGKLIESGTGTVIDFGDITLVEKENAKEKAYTVPDKDGQFSLSGIEDGEYNLVIKALGFDTYKRENIILKNAATLDLGVIELKSSDFGLQETVVVAQKRQIIYKLDKKVIEANSMQASGGSAIDVLENTPSVQINAEGELSFRGSSGFTVYIDGKPATLAGTQALEQIPAALVDNIEIITTPSARYDANGDVGIINVITKKQTQQGVSGMVNLTGSTVLSDGINFLLTKKIKKNSWRLGGTWEDKRRKSDFEQQKTTIVSDTSTLSHSKGPRKGSFYNYILRAGWSHSLPKTTFDVDAEGGYFGKSRRGELDYIEDQKQNGNPINTPNDYVSYDDYDNWKKFVKGSAGFFHKFNENGHTLAGNGFVQYDWHSLEYFQSDLFDKTPAHNRQQGHRAYEDEWHITGHATLDYINPYSETGRFEAGYKFHSYLEEGDYSMEYWNPLTQAFYWRDDIYNTFYFQEGVHSLYAILNERIKDFQFQVGVRAEHTHRELKSSKDWANRTFNRLEFFPSVHLGYDFEDAGLLMASYSRRTTRPDLFYMEPYLTFRDYYSAEIGNPDIRPEYINSFEANYKKNIDAHTFSLTGFYRNRKDKIERLRVPYEAGITLDSMANVGHDYSVGLELFSQIQATRWWTINANGSYYRYIVKNEYKLPGSNDGESNNYGISVGNMLDVAKNTRVQFDGFLVGPSVTTQGQTDSFWYINLALRQQLLNRKLSATLSVRDIFGSARYRSDINTYNLQSITNIKPYYPLITLTLNYTFNNYKAKQTKANTEHDLFEGTNH